MTEIIHKTEINFYLEKIKIKIDTKKTEDAKLLLDKVLEIDPHNFKANNLMGIVLGMANKHEEAIIVFKKLYKSKSTDPLINFNLACSLVNLGRDAEAICYFENANDLYPQNINIIINYGKCLMRLKKNKEALNILSGALKNFSNSFELNFYLGLINKNLLNYNKSLNFYNKAIIINKNKHNLWFEKGFALMKLNDVEEAIVAFNKSISLKPDFFQAYNNLGLAFKKKGFYEEAILSFNKAIALNPNFSEAYYNLGNCYGILEKFNDAEKYLRKALQLNPNYVEAINNIGSILRNLGKFSDAERFFRDAIFKNPNYEEAYNNLGLTLKDLMNYHDAEVAFNKAIKLNPSYAQAYYNLAFTLIYQHKFEKGYKLFEWRWKTKQKIGNKFVTNKPLWKGEPNKDILVWKEQGIGDEIMFGSIFKDIYLVSKSLKIFCDHRLVPLLSRSLPSDVQYISDLNLLNKDSYDTHLPIGSMPYFFRKNIKDFENSSNGYLCADTEKSSELRKKILSHKDQKIIGISWFTKSPNGLSSFRNINLKHIATLLSLFNFKLINLQYGDVKHEISILKNEYGIEILDIEEIDKFNDIDGLASLISACDLVISTTNVTVHLSGSLGKDTRVLLPLNPDARWGTAGTKSYWYKSVKLYRQLTLGDWSHPLNDLRQDLNILYGSETVLP